MNENVILFLDVDGPLSPYRSTQRRSGYRAWTLNGSHVLLNPDHGPALLDLPYELVWSTTWEHDANTHIAPRLGLPHLPVCEFPDEVDAPHTVGFKTPAIVEYATGRPFAWVDDEITDADREWVAQRHKGPALLHWVNPAVGLVESDFEALAAWARTLTPHLTTGRTPERAAV